MLVESLANASDVFGGYGTTDHGEVIDTQVIIESIQPGERHDLQSKSTVQEKISQ